MFSSPEVGCELRVDRVVGREGRLDEVDRLVQGGALEGLDFVGRVAREPARFERVREVVGAVGVHALRQGLREVDRLEGRSGLAVAVGREVVLGLLVALGLGHRLDVAVVRIDRHDRGRGVFGLVQDFGDRFAREPLHVQVDRRVDLQAALFDGLGAVALHQLLAHVFEEEVLFALGVEVAVVDLERVLLGRLRPGLG